MTMFVGCGHTCGGKSKSLGKKELIESTYVLLYYYIYIFLSYIAITTSSLFYYLFAFTPPLLGHFYFCFFLFHTAGLSLA